MAKLCPILEKECIEHGCAWYRHLVGMNPQTGQPTDEWNCAVGWLPLLLVENANMMRQATASVDKVANETRLVAKIAAGGNALIEQAKQATLEKKDDA